MFCGLICIRCEDRSAWEGIQAGITDTANCPILVGQVRLSTGRDLKHLPLLRNVAWQAWVAKGSYHLPHVALTKREDTGGTANPILPQSVECQTAGTDGIRGCRGVKMNKKIPVSEILLDWDWAIDVKIVDLQCQQKKGFSRQYVGE